MMAVVVVVVFLPWQAFGGVWHFVSNGLIPTEFSIFAWLNDRDDTGEYLEGSSLQPHREGGFRSLLSCLPEVSLK